MSEGKKAQGWAEILAESNTPGDDFSWNLGSNYGLDGYHFEQTMGEGVKERPAQPGATPGPPPGTNNTKGMHSLPGNLISAAESPLEASSLMNDFSGGISLKGFYDVEASAVDLTWLDPTQGQDPSRLPESPVDKGLEELEEAWGFGRRTDGVKRIPNEDLESARYRQQTQPATPGPKLAAEKRAQVKNAALKAVREAHFGKPVASIKRDLLASLGEDAVHTRAVVSRLQRDVGLMGNVFVRASAFPGVKNGTWVEEIKRKARSARYVITDDPTVGVKLGMQAVKEIPWGEALKHYGPRLRAAGYDLDLSSRDPEAILRKAFQEGPAASGLGQIERPKPVEVQPADTVSREDALREFQAHRQERLVIESDHGSKVRRAKALAKLSKWRASGALTSEQVMDLRKLGTDDMLKRASELVNTREASEYAGSGVVQTQDSQMQREASQGSTRTSEFEQLESWTRKALNEGLMGRELDQLMRVRWSAELLKAAKADLKSLRERHEGLAGSLYVDASAYATPTGAGGCKKASTKHRTNQVRTVLAMDRCASCVHHKTMKDGSGLCSVYNKPLMEASTLKRKASQLKVLQENTIRMANASDQEVTASLFTSPHTSIVAEYDLSSNMDVSLVDTPEVEKLGEILFGGMDIGEDS